MEKFWKHKSKLAAIALVLLMASVLLTLYMPAQAQELQPSGSVRLPAGVTPDVVVKTKACLSFRPNPVGVGQTILVNLWISPATHRSRYHTDYKVTITDPDGNEDVLTMDSYHADGTAWFEYVVDQTGTWKLKFDFPGSYFPAGIYVDPRTGNNVTFPGSCYYEPASTAEQELVVQEEMVLSWPPSPLPTDYWTRPVAVAHREWTSILGDFPWRGPGGGPDWPAETNKYYDPRYNFLPYVQGPNTAHIVWKRLGATSGLVGAGQGYAARTSSSGGPTVVYQGKCYQVITLPGGESGLQCYDLRTGEMYWEISPAPIPDGGALVGIEYTGLTTPAVPGATEQASAGASLVALSRERLVKINPWTGAETLNVSIMFGRLAYVRNGYVLSVQSLGGGNYRLINWTTFGSTSNFDNRVISNITWPFSRPPAPGIGFDFEAGFAAQTGPPISPPEVGAITSARLTVANLKTGATVWTKDIDKPPFDAYQAFAADHGKIALVFMDGTWGAWDLATGNLAWYSETMDYPWDATGFGAYGTASAYGLLFRFAYSGVYAFDWDDGTIAWKYEAPANPYETAYTGRNGTVYSFNAAGWVADGKVYAINTEHTPTAPLTRGWGIHCINATTGELVWRIMIPCGGRVTNRNVGLDGHPSGLFAIADGYMVASSTDGYMYVFGKGKTETTIEAPLTAIPLGQSIVLKGTVLDMSPAQPGTPCVSKDSMSGWMEYLHKQMPIPAEVNGVPVSLDTIDPNGNFIHIGDVTSDMSGMFSHMWTPEIPGKYTVIATFMGDDSYGSSYAETAVGVVEAPEEPEPVTPATEPEVQENIDRAVEDLNNSIMPILYGTIVAVVIVALLVVYDIFFRRR